MYRSLSEKVETVFPIIFRNFVDATSLQMAKRYSTTFSLGQLLGIESTWNFKMRRRGSTFYPAVMLLSTNSPQLAGFIFKVKVVIQTDFGVLGYTGDVFDTTDLHKKRFNLTTTTTPDRLLGSGEDGGNLQILFEMQKLVPQDDYELMKSEYAASKTLRHDMFQLLRQHDTAETILRVIRNPVQEQGVTVHDNVMSIRCPKLFQEMQMARVPNLTQETRFNFFVDVFNIQSLVVFVYFLYTSELKENWQIHCIDLVEGSVRYEVTELFSFLDTNMHLACRPYNCKDLFNVAKKYNMKASIYKIEAFCALNDSNFLTTNHTST